MLKPYYMVQQDAVTSYISFRNTNPLLILRGGQAVPPSPSRFEPLIEKLIPGQNHHANITAAIILAIFLKPFAKIYYEQLSFVFRKKIVTTTKRDKYGESVVTTARRRQPFDGSNFSHVIETIVASARLFLVVATFDILKIIVLCFGVKIPKSEHLTNVFGLGIYLLWGFRRLSIFKLYLLKKVMVNTDIINDPRRLQVINRLSDYGLIFFGIFAFYEVLNVEMGYSAKSLLAAFSFGTAAIALATKDIITNFLNGIVLSASNRIYEGDFISINGDIKKVNNLGWLEAALRGSDNILYTVPNTELVNKKLSNLSRVNTCQVRQTLRFEYKYMDKLPKLSQDIKSEIRSACSSIITDGSHPFRCYWINFGSKDLEVFVNAHFRIPPVGDAYYENRQLCLQAIDRAIRKNEIDKYTGG